MKVNYLANLAYIVPELIVLLTMLLVLILEATYSKRETSRSYPFVATVIGLFFALYALLHQGQLEGTLIFTQGQVSDSFSIMMKFILILGTLGASYVAWSSKELYNNFQSEFLVLILGGLLGGMTLVSTQQMLNLYVAIETLSILSYILAGLKKRDSRSIEAGLKYALYGGVSAGVMLFGLSHLYGLVGSLYFSDIAKALQYLPVNELTLAIMALLFFFVGLAYKASLVPFHMWSPDVYEGSPFAVTTFFAIVPKLAALGILARLSIQFFSFPGPLGEFWFSLLQVMSILTMTVGNITALGQKSVKRMLAYSSISHAGFMLLAVVSSRQADISSLLFYGLAYFFMTVLAFSVVSFVSDEYGNDSYDRFNGLMKHHPFMSILLVILMCSLGGLPPFSGFVAKFLVLSSLVSSGFYLLAIIGVLNSVISLYYYLRLVRVMVFSPSEAQEGLKSFSWDKQLYSYLLLVPVVFLGIFWNSFYHWFVQGTLFIQ